MERTMGIESAWPAWKALNELDPYPRPATLRRRRDGIPALRVTPPLSCGGVIPVDQLVALADDGAMGEVEDAAVLVVAPQPEDQHRLRFGDLQLLPQGGLNAAGGVVDTFACASGTAGYMAAPSCGISRRTCERQRRRAARSGAVTISLPPLFPR